MSYRQIEAWGQQGEDLITLHGRTYAAPALLEDEDGYRWLLLPSFFNLVPGIIAEAFAMSASALLVPAMDGPGWEALTVEAFIAGRAEVSGKFDYIAGRLVPNKHGSDYIASDPLIFDEPPSYLTLFRESKAAPIIASPKGFVHLHTHSEMSPLDGRSKIKEILEQAKADNQFAVAVTDHGVCSGHPELQKRAKEAGLKPIFGIEAYFTPDRHRRPKKWFETAEGLVLNEAVVNEMSVKDRQGLTAKSDIQEIKSGYNHLILLAQNQTGLRNVWGASSEAFRSGFYYYPKMDWEVLKDHAEGVIATTACLRGPLSVAILNDDEDLARANLGRLLDIFGDRLYLELHANSLPEQVKVNHALVALGQEYGVPLLAVVDSHYPTKEAYAEHQAWVAVQTNTDVQDETDLFSHDIGLYMQTETEVRQNLSYLTPQAVDEAVGNTVLVAEQCNASIETKKTIPVFSRQKAEESVEEVRARDIERLLDLCLSNWHLTEGIGKPSQEDYIARFEREMGLIIPKGFCGYYLQVSDYVVKMKSQGVLIGPGRGSGGGSLVAYLARITGIDPVEADLAFERFMTEGRTELPDFDVDFPASKRDLIQNYISERYGADHVVRIGTHLRSKNKGILKDLSRALKSTLPETAWKDFDEVSKIIDAAESGTAGLGLSWAELWAQEGDLLQPYADRYPQVFGLAETLVGLLKSYGKHPAGLVVSEDRLVDALPLRRGEDEDGTAQMVTQFDMKALEEMGYVKFDILTLRTLDTIQQCVDLIEERRGFRVDPYEWKDEYFDPQVWETISEGLTLGVFQVETSSGQRMCRQVRPQNLAEFADVLTLVRPGPMRSGLTQLYLDRREGKSEVTVPDPRLTQVLAPTYGAILYQEQVMQTCMLLAGYDSNKADEVRKILGKKKVELVESAGREFAEGCATHGMDRGAAEILWGQLAEFAKYSFGKAHAYGYAVLAYWTAWLKVHYPVEFYTSVLSTVKQDRIPEFISEARRFGFKVAPPDINESKRGFTAIELGVRYGLDSLKGVGDSALDKILPGQPYTSFEDFRQRSGVNTAVQGTLARIGAFDSLGENRRGLETLLLMEKSGDATKCVLTSETLNEHGLPCCFDWASEPPPVNARTGRVMKAKPVPKRCTKACRQYVAPEPLDPSTVAQYTEEDVRDIEMEVLGLHLSSTVFDRLPEDDRAFVLEQAEAMDQGREGLYIIAATVMRSRKHTDKNGNDMAFLGLMTERGELDVTAFKTEWAKFHSNLKVGNLAYFELYKNDRGVTLKHMSVI